jgi:hypothetical protein
MGNRTWVCGVALCAAMAVAPTAARADARDTAPAVAPLAHEVRALLEPVQALRGALFGLRVALVDAVAAPETRLALEPFRGLEPAQLGWLAERLDADGGTTVIYWACGSGREFEVVGDFTAEQCRSAAFRGPSHAGFGKATFLAPAVRYFVDRFEDAKNGMYVFITDGRIDDLDDVKRLSMELCQQIAAGRRNRLKFVLIGVGRQVDEGQMTELDDLDSGTDVDLWDHKIAREMRQLAEIFAEVVDERQIVAPVGKLVDSSGNVIRAMSDGVPARLEFEIGSEHGWFELVVGEHRIRQALPPHSGGGG